SNDAPIAAATSAAETARQTAEEKARLAEAAREPVRQFRSGVWYGVVCLVALALCCGVVSILRPDGRFPLGFSTVGSVGLAVFLVIAAGWDDAKASAQAPNASVSVKEESSSEFATGRAAGTEPAAPAQAADLARAPGAPNVASRPGP